MASKKPGTEIPKDLPSPSDKDIAEGERDIVERELDRVSRGRSSVADAPPAPSQPAVSGTGNVAAPGTPGTGEDICPRCHGSGAIRGKTCELCDGVGKIVVGVGGA